MAVLLAKTMGQMNEERKNVYPLFQKPSKAMKSELVPTASVQQTSDGRTEETSSKSDTGRGCEKPLKELARNDAYPRPSSNVAMILPPQKKGPDLLEVDPNNYRRKRQKRTSIESEITKIEDVPLRAPRRQQVPSSSKEPGAFEEVDQVEEKVKTVIPMSVINRSGNHHPSTQVEESAVHPALRSSDAPLPENPNLEAQTSMAPSPVSEDRFKSSKTSGDLSVDSKPKKLLHFNPKTGTIGSPPEKKSAALIETTSKPRSNSRIKQPKSKLVKICYGRSTGSVSAIGLQLEQILKGSERVEAPAKKRRPSLEATASWTSKATDASSIAVPSTMNTKAATIAPSRPSAPLHPFFSGKPLLRSTNLKDTMHGDTVAIEVDPHGLTSVGRVKPAAREGKPPDCAKDRSSAFTGFRGFDTSTKFTKFPGAIEPAWPWKGMVHVRGNEIAQEDQDFTRPSLAIRSRLRKSKYHAIEILAQEDVLTAMATALNIDQMLESINDLRLDEYSPLPDCLRTPLKFFESGLELQKRTQRELHTRLPQSIIANDDESDDEIIQDRGSSRKTIHPALCKTYASIATSLSAFDSFRYETQLWTQKHSPKCAAEVLQTGREALILKEWLQRLTVTSVETGGSDQPTSRASSVSRLVAASKSEPGKRKRKLKKLDGFIVSSDEEDNDMDEISEPEDSISLNGSQNLFKKTVMRQGDLAGKGSKGQKLTNAIVISGPHGCGKTAAVYAVAKELKFEVFEINSSSRRSGKDILERVGDMTRNHLVQRAHDQTPLGSLDEDDQRLSAFAENIQSSRQGTMNTFFTTKVAESQISQPKASEPITKSSKPTQTTLAPKAPPKQQKQSLILFEEVDVLYEEDKQFWSTVVSLIAQSRRPIIMTCQDESVLPIQALSLHAILRFSPPPIDIAADHLLLVAASEGHALKRSALTALYQSRHFDLRASLTELNFWCQFAVGDIRGGLDWLYPRWPLGCDVDDNGNTIRVISEKTYELGMGWLSQDFLESHTHYLSCEEETLREANDGWNLDLGHWQKSIDMKTWAAKTQASSSGRADDRVRLHLYEDFAESMSVADLFSGSAFVTETQIELDFTMPTLSGKVREDYLSNHPIIDATPRVEFDKTGLNISFWIKSQAREHLQVEQYLKHGLGSPPELDRPNEAHIVDLIEKQASAPESAISRQDLSLAFDPISEPEKPFWSGSGQLEASVFDRTQTIIATDLAPYVRSIVSYDAKLQQERNRMSNLLSEGGRKGKRMRTTRAAFSALEGGARSTTRRDRYFGPGLNPYLVLKTGMPSWLEAVPSSTLSSIGESTRWSTGDSDFSRGESDDGETNKVEVP